MYIVLPVTLAQYVPWVPDSITRLPGPAGLLASDSGISPRIQVEPNHTQAGLFTIPPLGRVNAEWPGNR